MRFDAYLEYDDLKRKMIHYSNMIKDWIGEAEKGSVDKESIRPIISQLLTLNKRCLVLHEKFPAMNFLELTRL